MADPRLAEARRQKLAVQVERARFELTRERERFIERATVEKFMIGWNRSHRDDWIGWVARVAPVLAHKLDLDPQAAFALLDRLVREQLLEIEQMPMPNFSRTE